MSQAVIAEKLNRASDLDKCAQEPIHIIGQIQPHGMLFALSEPDLIVRQVSANVSALLGTSPEALLGRSFEAVLGGQQFEIFRSRTLSQEALEENPLRIQLAGGAREMLCEAHRHDGVLIVELELQEGAYSFEPLSLNAHIRLPLARLELASGIAELAALAASEIRRLSGFGRVMVYRFDEEWNGEVIAESAAPSAASYLGLHFPASDIPAQARQLFLQNPLRAIADVDASPVPIVPETGPLTGRPLDLTLSVLRSPSLVHLEYLRNMGVRSSLTVSIVIRQQLWGLIACHHAAPHLVDYSARSVCELVGQILGSQLALRTANVALQLQLAFRRLMENYLAQIDAANSPVFADFFHSHRLLELFSADGLVLSLDGVISTHGHALQPAALLPAIDRLRKLSSKGIASSNMLSALDPSAISYASEISGALYMELGRETGDYLLLLRRELVATVTWAGNPDKSVNTDAQGRLHPRASFQAWQENVHGRSLPWSELEMDGARALRLQLLERRVSLESELSKQRFRLLSDAIPQLIWTAKPDGKVDYYNPRWVSYTGLSLGQSVESDWEQVVHPEDLAKALERWKASIVNEGVYELELRLRRASDGAYRWYLARAVPLRNQKGEVISWVGTATEIDSQKQVRQDLEREVTERTAELTRSRAQLQSVLSGATNVAIIATNVDGIITQFNSGAENLLGYTAEELVGRQTPEIFHLASEIAARGLELTEELGKPVEGFDVFVEKPQKGGHEEREWTYVRKDGSHLTINGVVTALKDPAGTVSGFIGVAMDITARKAAEKTLRDQAQMLDLANDAILIRDSEFRLTYWNQGAESLYGWNKNEALGQVAHALLKTQFPEPLPDIQEQLLLVGHWTGELMQTRRDGSLVMVASTLTLQRDDASGLSSVLAINHDITARKQADDQLKIAMRRLSLSTNALEAGVWDWNIRTNAVAWDERMFEIYGLPADKVASYQLWASALLPEDLAAAEASLQSTVATKSQGSMQFRIRVPDGSVRYIQAAHGTILDDAGEVVSVIGINIDTTDRKFNEDLEQQVADRTAELKAANHELEQFVYVASHDLKAPLRAIHNSAKWLEEDLEEHLTGETREHLDALRARVKRMEKLLDDLLEYARIGRSADSRYDESIRGDLLMADVLALLSVEGFTVEVSPGFANIAVRRMPLQQILMNLIGNGIKHHDKKTGKIGVTVEDEGDFYSFAVKDDGPGIAAQFHDQVFEMFRTLRRRDEVEGSGMGLAMVRKHIEVGGGTLRLESALGEGSTFRFIWPKKPQLRKERG